MDATSNNNKNTRRQQLCLSDHQFVVTNATLLRKITQTATSAPRHPSLDEARSLGNGCGPSVPSTQSHHLPHQVLLTTKANYDPYHLHSPLCIRREKRGTKTPSRPRYEITCFRNASAMGQGFLLLFCSRDLYGVCLLFLCTHLFASHLPHFSSILLLSSIDTHFSLLFFAFVFKTTFISLPYVLCILS